MSTNRCIYCLSNLEPITIDHVVPRSWYPDVTPVNQEKWKAPCCEPCNNSYSKIEKNLLERIGLCLDPNDLITKGIPQKALRAYKPRFGKNKKDALHRSLKRDAIVRKLYDLKGDSLKGVLPHFGPSQKTRRGDYATVQISHIELKKVGEKFIRGMMYATGGHYIGPEYLVECFVNDEIANASFDKWYSNHGVAYQIAPGIDAIIVTCDQPLVSTFRFKIWNKLILHGSVLPVNES